MQALLPRQKDFISVGRSGGPRILTQGMPYKKKFMQFGKIISNLVKSCALEIK
jgi:hypothetical protein